MKRILHKLSILGVLLTILVWSVFEVSPTKVSASCSYMQIWNNFLAANDTFSGAFNDYYANFYQSPAKCQTDCLATCNAIQDPVARQTCLQQVNLQQCADSCSNTITNSYYNAQDNLMSAAAETCQESIRLTCSEIQQRIQDCDSQYNATIESTTDYQIQQAAYYSWNACQIANSQIPCD